MLNKALEAFEDLGDDEELGPADWLTVKRYITSLNNLQGDRVHPHTTSEADNNLDPTNLKDIRIRLLNGKYLILFIKFPGSSGVFHANVSDHSPFWELLWH